MSIYAKVIADSISPIGARLTTMEIQCHRFVLAEFNTHRRFSRNSASSRAIPFDKQLARMEELGLAYPLSWPREQSGMQGGEEFDDDQIEKFRDIWAMGARTQIQVAEALHNTGVHKSVVNRILEPFMWHKIIVSSTEWKNFFDQRCSPLAQPEIRVVAEHMQYALQNSEPKKIGWHEWHLPYVDDEDYESFEDLKNHGYDKRMMREVPLRVSAARCARVSYLTHDGKRDPKIDLDLFSKLINADPPHWSPLEHVAYAVTLGDLNGTGNFDYWRQLRHAMPRLAA